MSIAQYNGRKFSPAFKMDSMSLKYVLKDNLVYMPVNEYYLCLTLNKLRLKLVRTSR
jgi:hypothetical protein